MRSSKNAKQKWYFGQKIENSKSFNENLNHSYHVDCMDHHIGFSTCLCIKLIFTWVEEEREKIIRLHWYWRLLQKMQYPSIPNTEGNFLYLLLFSFLHSSWELHCLKIEFDSGFQEQNTPSKWRMIFVFFLFSNFVRNICFHKKFVSIHTKSKIVYWSKSMRRRNPAEKKMFSFELMSVEWIFSNYFSVINKSSPINLDIAANYDAQNSDFDSIRFTSREFFFSVHTAR